jgi:mercuric ion transport protein
MREILLAAGGAVSALAASTCCIAPLALVSVGVSGAWIGGLTALAPYQPLFVAVAVTSIGTGFWLVYRRTPTECAAGACAAVGKGRLLKGILWVKTILWLGATLVALSVGADYGARLFL